MNSAIIVAAGKGTRFNSQLPKQFSILAGKPVFIHAIERFQTAESIDEIILVTSLQFIDEATQIAEKYNFSKLKRIAAGADSRAGSVRNGFKLVDQTSEVVAIHDGARPLVPSGDVDGTVYAASKKGAACLVAAVTDTIKIVKGDRITGTIDRDTLRRALTPQAFRFEVLERALASREPDDSITDECSLVESLGFEVVCIDGDPRNIKITRAEDFKIAELFLTENV